jgi:hypothetical protein
MMVRIAKDHHSGIVAHLVRQSFTKLVYVVRRVCLFEGTSSLGGHVSVDEGEAVTLCCQASQFGSNGSITFVWFRLIGQSEVPVTIDDERVKSEQNASQGDFIGKLSFLYVSQNDSGSYKCKAHGPSNFSTQMFLDVKCKFDAI